ncbi:hypothetical protein CVU76_01375 [Candidatus Dojkabacteria bacterium HGW-Dojkabacteria-1]|uniref:Uncharacterized protein n=1 Tax=Candidatus Dojkabacteria bacterium HGW-Dojkabacteria-1 TaxID=2013761 RepID=A0A2N2F3A5_9BACT|nr:MAG: hypothetical protein CVU76_01375 [Candidatus Dojkabacteria bacterium HGW-Dojkabacteria-1]
MPTFTNDNGDTVWIRDESKPALYVGNPKSQRERLDIRRERTVICTARAMRLEMTEEELEDVIARNAQNVEMEPDDLRELALQYLELEETNSNGIEKE